jgi:hypothetical protein
VGRGESSVGVSESGVARSGAKDIDGAAFGGSAGSDLSVIMGEPSFSRSFAWAAFDFFRRRAMRDSWQFMQKMPCDVLAYRKFSIFRLQLRQRKHVAQNAWSPVRIAKSSILFPHALQLYVQLLQMRDPSPSKRRFASESRRVPQVLQRKQLRCHLFPAVPLLVSLSQGEVIYWFSHAVRAQYTRLECPMATLLRVRAAESDAASQKSARTNEANAWCKEGRKRAGHRTEFECFAFFEDLVAKLLSAIVLLLVSGATAQSGSLPLHSPCMGTRPRPPWRYPCSRPWLSQPLPVGCGGMAVQRLTTLVNRPLLASERASRPETGSPDRLQLE